MIREGAVLCENADDILAEFEHLALGQADDSPTLPLANLTETEQKILEVLDAIEQQIDTFIDKTGLPVSSVSVALLGLEMKRLTSSCPASYSPVGKPVGYLLVDSTLAAVSAHLTGLFGSRLR